MLHIMVCIKQVVDPEAPPSTFKIDPEAKRAIPAAGVPPVLNPYDENALEAGLRIKDLHPQGGRNNLNVHLSNSYEMIEVSF